MPPPLPPLIRNAELTWDDSRLPRSTMFGDIYFSAQGPLEESRHVFLAGNDLPGRWQHNGEGIDRRFTVGEIGFGSGLNFLLTWQAWRATSSGYAGLHYLAFEQWPLRREDLRGLLGNWPELDDLARQLLAGYPEHSAGLHRLTLADDVTLDLYLDDALHGLEERHGHDGNTVHCWYLDGFSPDRNPRLWSQPLMSGIARHSGPGTTFSTYSVAGIVRRNLQAAGFTTRKLPGFANKREMLAGELDSANRTSADTDGPDSARLPWFRIPRSGSVIQRQVVVIGGGLAGCATAASLSRRGWEVTLIDRQSSLASGGSGNSQAALQCRLSVDGSPLARFHLLAFLFAARHYRQLQQTRGLAWHGTGVISLGRRQRRGRTNLDAAAGAGAEQQLVDCYDERVIKAMNAAQLSELAGVAVSEAGFFMPDGGWLNPARLCHVYCDDPNITLRLDSPVTSLQRQDDHWLVMSQGQTIATAPVVVLANAHEAATLEQSAFCPLLPVRGQVSLCKATAQSSRLACVVSGEKYLCPAEDGLHTVGASYQPGQEPLQIRDTDARTNLAALAAMLDPAAVQGLSVMDNRAALRCSSADRAPLIGALPDAAAMKKEFAKLARNARSQAEGRAHHHGGLFINVAHGSHGLATCPLAAEIIAGLICDESLPVTSAELDTLNPARFIIRDLKRQKTAG